MRRQVGLIRLRPHDLCHIAQHELLSVKLDCLGQLGHCEFDERGEEVDEVACVGTCFGDEKLRPHDQRDVNSDVRQSPFRLGYPAIMGNVADGLCPLDQIAKFLLEKLTSPGFTPMCAWSAQTELYNEHGVPPRFQKGQRYD